MTRHGTIISGRYLLIFFGVQAVLFTLTLLEPVRRAVIVPFTEALAVVSAWLMMRFDASVLADGVLIQNAHTGFAVEIAAGCNGVEPMIILLAAIVAFPAPLRAKLQGIVGGFFAIQVLNLGRIVTLYYLGQWNESVFEWAHLYVWPALILIDALVVWLLWVHYLQSRPHAAAA